MSPLSIVLKHCLYSNTPFGIPLVGNICAKILGIPELLSKISIITIDLLVMGNLM